MSPLQVLLRKGASIQGARRTAGGFVSRTTERNPWRCPVKRYEGKRCNGIAEVSINGVPLNPRLDLHKHSITGFEWGYCGGGPAQLALALLADHLANDAKAMALYQDFKLRVIARLSHSGWSLTSTD